MRHHPFIVMARRVRATYRGAVLVEVARTRRAMTILAKSARHKTSKRLA
jgi:hypothetical protein